eukprot:TRINITY_DN2100_c0_g2_i2.p2 TRINITY_DN2100_c0_g2~~TRINITY_DN2100_c0_g2_i2.p2  ORF type:complete len:153 (-),score=25.65 TRINITY_DN2100_c0_g2_i2:1639-2064(-)
MESSNSLNSTYQDWEKRQYDVQLEAYQSKIRNFKKDNPREEWKCSTCGAKNSGRLYEDRTGLWGQYCQVKSCQYSTIIVKRPEMSSDQASWDARDLDQYETNKKHKAIQELIKKNPLPKDLCQFDWKWIHEDVREGWVGSR